MLSKGYPKVLKYATLQTLGEHQENISLIMPTKPNVIFTGGNMLPECSGLNLSSPASVSQVFMDLRMCTGGLSY